MIDPKIKFLTDAMLGKLTVLLRIFGYDTVYANDLLGIDLSPYDQFPDPLPNPIPDDILLAYAKLTDRIVLTKDYPFHRKAKNLSFYLEDNGTYNYLKQLKNKFGLKYSFDMNKARCSSCNSPIKKISDKSSLKQYLQESTFNNYEVFFQCINPNCKKVYWDGPHVKDIKSKLKKHLLDER